MATDWNHPVVADDTDDVLDYIKARDVDALTMCITDPSNKPVGAIRWNRSTLVFQEWSGSAWANLSSGSLGTMASQNSNAVAITGGTIGGAVDIDGTRITSGQVPGARLGSATPSAYTMLFGDLAWKEYGIGQASLWFTATPPTGWVILNGQSLVRATYPSLYALLGTTFGAADGTHFNVPDLRGYFIFGKAASGTGSTLNGVFGAIDHTHTGAAHVHTSAAHTHSGPSHSHTVASHTHTVGDHTHTISNHTHTFGTSSDGDHGHTGTTSSAFGNQAAASGSSFNAGRDDHYHTFSSDINGAHTHSGTTDSGGNDTNGISGGAYASGAATPSTDSASGTTGSTTPSDVGSTTPGAGGTNNPPGFAVNFIMKAL